MFEAKGLSYEIFYKEKEELRFLQAQFLRYCEMIYRIIVKFVFILSYTLMIVSVLLLG